MCPTFMYLISPSVNSIPPQSSYFQRSTKLIENWVVTRYDDSVLFFQAIKMQKQNGKAKQYNKFQFFLVQLILVFTTISTPPYRVSILLSAINM